MQIKFILQTLIALLFVGTASAQVVELVPESSASFIRAELSASPPHKFTGEVKRYTLDLQADLQRQEITGARFGFRFLDFDTDNEKRDKKMFKWMDVETHPDIEFTLTRMEQENGSMIAVGDFAMHGQVREVRVPCTFSASDGRFVLDAAYTLDHRDWGLPKVRLLIFTVNPVMEITIHIEGTYAAS